MIYLDTHVVVWLYGGLISHLTHAAREAIEAHDLMVSPMVVLELGYLQETGRITQQPHLIMEDLGRRIGIRVCDRHFGDVVAEALSERWTRDPFDRIIVAQAKLTKASLVSKDELVRKNYRQAVW